MNRIETIIQKFDINPCTLSLPEAREYLYHLHEQSKPFKNKELSAEAQKEFNDILERLKIIEIFYEALQKQDDSSWLDYDKLSYRLEQTLKEALGNRDFLSHLLDRQREHAHVATPEDYKKVIG